MGNDRTLHGIIPYVVSPIDPNGLVRTDVLGQLIESLIEDGVHGICVLGSTGEFPLLSLHQSEAIVECAVSTTGGRVPVVAGVSGFSTQQLCQNAQQWARLGVDALVVMPNQYFPLSQKALVSMYRDVAQAVNPLSVILYANPKYMHFDISMQALSELEGVENIRYIKDASGITGKLLSLRQRFGDRYSIFSASAHIPLFVLMLGGVGWMSGPSCLIPKQSIRLYNLVQQGNIEEVLALQQEIWSLNQLFSEYDLVACIKAGLEYLGYGVGDPIAPLSKLGLDDRNKIYRVLDRIRAL